MSEPDLKTLWQQQPTEYDPMTLEHIRTKANAFQKKIRRRNLVEYLAMVVVVLGFSPLLFATQSWMMQAGGALIILATPFIAWQLHRRGSARKTPDAATVLADFHRAELVRQRDALRSTAAWYLGPLVPGVGDQGLVRGHLQLEVIAQEVPDARLDRLGFAFGPDKGQEEIIGIAHIPQAAVIGVV